MKKIIKTLLVLSLFFVFSTGRLQAQPEPEGDPLVIICQDEGPCSIDSGPDPLFSETNFYPGNAIVREIQITNEDVDDDCDLYLTAQEKSDPDNLSDVLITVIASGPQENVIVLYGRIPEGAEREDMKNLTDLFNEEDKVYLNSIPTEETNTYYWAVFMDPEAGNEYQENLTEFDFDLSFDCGVSPTSTPTPVPTSTPTISPDDSEDDFFTTTADAAADTGAETGGILGLADEGEEGPTPVVGFEEESVLGEESEAGQIESGEQVIEEGVKGEVTGQRVCFWWWLLGLGGLAINSGFVLINKEKLEQEKWQWLVPAFVSGLVFAGDKIAHQWWNASNYCSYIWLVSLLTFILPFSLYRLIQLKK